MPTSLRPCGGWCAGSPGRRGRHRRREGFTCGTATPAFASRTARASRPEQATLKIDVRGDGGYVIAPGSVHASGAAYLQAGDWSEPRARVPVFWPGWLARPRRPAAKPTPRLSHSEALARARAYLATIPKPEIGCGSDADTLYAACRLVRGFALSPVDAEDLLWEWAGDRSGWTRQWVAQKVAHAAALRHGSDRVPLVSAPDAWIVADPIPCPICGREACEDHLEAPAPCVTSAREKTRSLGADGERLTEAGAAERFAQTPRRHPAL